LKKSWCNLQPWPEAVEVLKKLKTLNPDLKLGILSNGDYDCLEQIAKNNFGEGIFDYIFSS